MKYLFVVFLFAFVPLQAAEFDELLDQLSDHLEGKNELSPEDLSFIEAGIIENAPSVSDNIELVTRSFGLISKYDEDNQPLFLNEPTRGGFSRSEKYGLELEHVIFQLQQAILDHAYHLENVKN